MLGILQHLTSFWARWRWLPTADFSRGSTPVHWIGARKITYAQCPLSVTVFEMSMNRFSQGGEICLFLVKLFQRHRGGEREWSSNRIRLHPGTAKRRKRPCGQGRTTQRGQSVDGGRRRGARGIRGEGVERRASAGGSTWRVRGRGLWKRTREGRIGVVEEDEEQSLQSLVKIQKAVPTQDEGSEI